jgi:hypothetical protein
LPAPTVAARFGFARPVCQLVVLNAEADSQVVP